MDQATMLLAQDSAALYKKAAHIVLESIAQTIKEHGQATLAFSGGTTPKKLFELLAESYYAERIDWLKLHIFFVDERCVPPQHAESNYGMVQAALFSKVPLPAGNIHRVAGEMSSPQEAAKAYENELRAFFKSTQPFPTFDLVWLGLGEDGHTASLFPKSEALEERDHWVTSSQNRITFTLPVLNKARRVIFLVSGPSKARVLREVLAPQTDRPKLPAQFVKPESGELVWLFDREAAGKLPPEVRYKALYI